MKTQQELLLRRGDVNHTQRSTAFVRLASDSISTSRPCTIIPSHLALACFRCTPGKYTTRSIRRFYLPISKCDTNPTNSKGGVAVEAAGALVDGLQKISTWLLLAHQQVRHQPNQHCTVPGGIMYCTGTVILITIRVWAPHLLTQPWLQFGEHPDAILSRE